MSDPRVFFAAERTLLAWVRSGLTVMALGFVVAKFGLFLRLLGSSSDNNHSHWPSIVLGITLVTIGAGITLGALHNHRLYVRSLPAEDRPELALPWLSSLLSLTVAIVGLLLAVYLAIA